MSQAYCFVPDCSWRSLVAHRESQFDRTSFVCYRLREFRRHCIRLHLLIDFGKLLLGFLGGILIWVVLLRQLVVGLLNIGLGGVLFDSQDICINLVVPYRFLFGLA